VVVLEEPSHGGEEASNALDPEAREGRGWGRELVVVYSSPFEQVKRPGGAVLGGGEDI
jgi:hypothetical protein